MVTSAVWSDIDQNGWADLVLVGEWMPITIYLNKNGKLTEKNTLKESSGLWNCIYKTDVDEDGDDDFLLGNWGSNTKLKANSKHPLLLALADWDGNGETDPLLCIYKQDNYYSFLGKADLERRVPAIKKKYLTYTEIAGQPATELFGRTAFEKSQQLKADILENVVVLNEKGRLVMQKLPSFLQTAPVFTYAKIPNSNQWIAGGNFYDVLPYEGRYDALLPQLFSWQKGQFINNGFVKETGAIKQIQTIKTTAGNSWLFCKNNDSLKLFTFHTPTP
jgi:enediyne biosynthesis protein E4